MGAARALTTTFLPARKLAAAFWAVKVAAILPNQCFRSLKSPQAFCSVPSRQSNLCIIRCPETLRSGLGFACDA